MTITPKIQKALNLAVKLHAGKKRKLGNFLYIVHPISVAMILLNYTKDEDIICAALLHDVLEDVAGYKEPDLKKHFDDKVVKIVKEVSEEKNILDNIGFRKSTWQKRKDDYLVNLKTASREALMVSCADKIHNLTSLINSYKNEGEKIWGKFNASKEKKLWFYKEVRKILKKRLNNKIVAELELLCQKANKLIK